MKSGHLGSVAEGDAMWEGGRWHVAPQAVAWCRKQGNWELLSLISTATDAKEDPETAERVEL